jgi:fumarate reductase flavoprotein subunit
MRIERHKTDILILGSGGAGLFAALHASQANPDLDITIAVKGLLGKSGCTRMVQGGYNVALAAGDSVERHFMDTIEGGKWLPRQDLAWRLCAGAVERVRELENEVGCCRQSRRVSGSSRDSSQASVQPSRSNRPSRSMPVNPHTSW